MDIQKERGDFEAWFAKSHYHKHLIENFWDAWQAAKAQAIPDGFVLVPKEPTEKMLDAARRRQWDDLGSPLEDMDMLKYKAMLGAREQAND